MAPSRVPARPHDLSTAAMYSCVTCEDCMAPQRPEYRQQARCREMDCKEEPPWLVGRLRRKRHCSAQHNSDKCLHRCALARHWLKGASLASLEQIRLNFTRLHGAANEATTSLVYPHYFPHQGQPNAKTVMFSSASRAENAALATECHSSGRVAALGRVFLCKCAKQTWQPRASPSNASAARLR